jgi:flagellar hook protein FlgE
MRGQGKQMESITSGVAGIGKSGSSEGSGTGVGITGGARAVTMDDLPEQMMNLNKATRAYQANVAVLKRYERMINTTLELLR